MRVLNRYIFRQIFSSVLVVLLLVLSLDFIGKIIDQLDNLRGGYTFYEMLIYILWSVPASVYEFMPYTVLVGCLIGLGALAGNSELVVVRAAGVSIVQIAWMALKSVLFFILLALLLGEYVVPYAEQTAESRRALALGYSTEDQASRGVWHREADDFILFSVVQPDGTLFGITRYHFEQGKLSRVSNTKKAVYENGRWHESDVKITHFEENNRLTIERIEQQIWNTELTPELLNTVSMEPSSLSISKLHNYSQYLAGQNLHNGEYALAFWQKALQPLATISLMLIAISFVFGPLRQVSMGQKIFTGVVFGIGFQLVQSLLGPSSLVFGFSPLVAVLIPIALCYLAGFYLLKRAG